MRRGRNMNRGGGGGHLDRSGPSGGPLLTEHLKDIDLELELLKRKREMLEKQQYLQSYEERNYTQQIQPFNYQQSYNQMESIQSGSNCDFSHLYNDAPPQYRKPFAKKRQSDSVWQHDSYPKRSTGSTTRGSGYGGRSPVRQQRSYTGPSHQPRGSFKSGPTNQGQKNANQKNFNQNRSRPDRNFVPNKITKHPKTSKPPNKLASKPAAQRTDLVAAALKSVSDAETRDREALRLHPDQEPTKQMIGRMELALGAILRDIRQICANSPYEESMRSSELQRNIKKGIRDAIRSVMMGKIVGATTEILAEYRAQFPKESDMDIVNKAFEVSGMKPPSVKPIVSVKEAEKPDEFFRKNMCKLIDIHLNEMFEKVHEIYNPPTNVEGEETQKETVTPKDNVEGKGDDKNGEGNKEGDKPAVENEDDKPAGENVEKKEVAEKQEVKDEVKNNENNEVVNGGIQETNEKIDIKKENSQGETPEELAVKLKNATIHDYRRNLPRLLKRHIPNIIKMLNVNQMYKKLVSDLNTTTRSMYAEYGTKTDPLNQVADKFAATAQKATTSTPNANKFVPGHMLPYYVKIMGKPQLPKKKVMHSFLEVFNPKSIKKHRTIHNLLFIGFSEQSDFDGIVKADGTIIGRSTLSIRICDKNTKPEDNVNTSQNVSIQSTDNKEMDTSGSDIIGRDMDNEITALLSSIRNAENTEDIKSEEKNDSITEKETAENTEKEPENTSVEINYEKVVDNGDAPKTETNNENGTSTEEIKTEEAENPETINDKKESEVDNNVSEKAEVDNNISEKAEVANEEIRDQVSDLKNAATGKATPTRASTRLASAPTTPSTIRTRRASRLQN